MYNDIVALEWNIKIKGASSKKWMIKKMSGISEFIDTLDCLYELGKIEFDEEEEVLRYAVWIWMW